MNLSAEVTEVQDRGPAAYIAEFIGTLFLVFFVTAVVSLYVALPTRLNPVPFIDFSVIGLVHAFLLFALIQTLAVISGAHFNPAVTVAMAVLRQIKPPDALVYIVAQLAGGVAGALLTKLLLEDEGRAVHYGIAAVSARLNEAILPGMVVEGIGTFFLVWVIVGVAVNPRATKEWAALAIGATLGMLVMVLGPLTGGCLQPRSRAGARDRLRGVQRHRRLRARLRRGTRDRRRPRSGGLQLPRHCARTEGPRWRGAGRLADQATKATIALPARKSVKIVAYQNGEMSGEPYTKCSGVMSPVNE